MKFKKPSFLLFNIKKNLSEDKVTLKNILYTNDDSIYFILFLMTIFSFIPTPFIIPIISSFFGIIMIIISFQILIGKTVLQLPKFIYNIKIKRKLVVNAIEKISPFFRKLEFLTKRRLIFIFNSKKILNFINFINFLLSILATTPIPFITMFPAFSLVFILFGILNKDGLFVLIGLLLAIASFTIFGLFIFCGKIFITKLMHSILGIF